MATPTLTEIRDNVATVQAKLDSYIAAQNPVPSRPVKRINAGDNIAAKVNDGLADTIYELPVDYVFNGDVEFTKPCTLTHAVPSSLPPGRVNLTTPLPLLRGQFVTRAGVVFNGVRMEGNNKDRNVFESYGAGTAFDRSIIQGGPNGSCRGIHVQSDDGYATRCHVGNHWYKGREVQAIGAVKDAHRWVVDDSFLESAGENFMIGGDDIGTEAQMCSDWQLTNSHLFKPLAWAAFDDPLNPDVENRFATCKNLFELKAVRRFLMRNVIMENNWVNAQSGFAFLLTPRNQNGKDPFATVSDVLCDGVTIRNSPAGINVLGRDNIHASQVMNNVTLKNFTIEMTGGTSVLIAGGPRNLTLDGFKVSGQAVKAFGFGEPQFPLEGFKVLNSYWLEGEYGIHGDTAPALGKPVLDMYAPGYTWTANTVKQGGYRFIPYPDGTTRVI